MCRSLEVPLRKPRPARQVKALGSDSVSDASAPFSLSKMTKERNPRTGVMKSVQSSVVEVFLPNNDPACLRSCSEFNFMLFRIKCEIPV